MQVYHLKEYKGEFFKILGQTKKSQLGVMTLEPNSDSGPEEIHGGDQLIYIIEGEAHVEVNKQVGVVREGMAAIIPAGSQHHIYNRSNNAVFFLTIYAPPAYE